MGSFCCPEPLPTQPRPARPQSCTAPASGRPAPPCPAPCSRAKNHGTKNGKHARGEPRTTLPTASKSTKPRVDRFCLKSHRFKTTRGERIFLVPLPPHKQTRPHDRQHCPKPQNEPKVCNEASTRTTQHSLIIRGHHPGVHFRLGSRGTTPSPVNLQ